MTEGLSTLLALLPIVISFGIYFLTNHVQDWVRFGAGLGILGVVLWTPNDESNCVAFRQGLPGGYVLEGVRHEEAEAADCNNRLGIDMWGTTGRITTRVIVSRMPVIGSHVADPRSAPPDRYGPTDAECIMWMHSQETPVPAECLSPPDFAECLRRESAGLPVPARCPSALTGPSPLPDPSSVGVFPETDLTADLASIALSLMALPLVGRNKAGARAD